MSHPPKYIPFSARPGRDSPEIIPMLQTAQTFLNLISVFHYTSSPQKVFRPFVQSRNNVTEVDQVIALTPRLGDIKTLSEVSRAYIVNLYSFTPLLL